MGAAFRRDRDSPGANALLNYGYAVIRATVARAVVAAGLHPTIGIAHANRGNAFALADDLVEPFRPLVDALVVAMIGAGVDTLDPALKRRFAQLIALDLRLGDELSPLAIAAAPRPVARPRLRDRAPRIAAVRAANVDRVGRPRPPRPPHRRCGMSYLSGYRLMWIFVMFDLPVVTKEQARAASKFREFLLDEGFEMSQFSVYARFCSGKDSVDAHLARIERHLPDRGEIHVLTFTDRQYENIVRFSSQRRQRPRANPDQLAMF